MGCSCNQINVGTNCQCSVPIQYVATGPVGATGAAGADGANGTSILTNSINPANQVGVYNGALHTYSFDTTNLVADGDRIKVTVIFEVTATAAGYMRLNYNGSLCGDIYYFVAGPAKQMKMEVYINRISAAVPNNIMVDQTWFDVPSITGDASNTHTYPYSLISAAVGGNVDIVVFADQTEAGATIYLRQFLVELMQTV